MKRILIGIACLCTFAVSVFAQKPIIVSNPFTQVFYPTQSFCGFDVLISPQEGKPNTGKIIYFANSGIMSGPLFATLKNLTSGKTVDISISGPVLLDFTSGQIIMYGPGIPAILLPADVAAAANLPRLPLFHGRAAIQIDFETLTISSVTATGKVDDVCELLQ